MLKYLVILLDDSSVSYCNYDARAERRLISAEHLRDAILFAMSENLNLQIVWPDYDIPRSHKDIIAMHNHINIANVTYAADADITVTTIEHINRVLDGATVICKLSFEQLITKPENLVPLIKKSTRINILLDNVEFFTDEMIQAYSKALDKLSEAIVEEYRKGHYVQLNLLTDRFMLETMNNCNAGVESLIVAPDGKFYICPAFYYGGEPSVGSPADGISIKNPQLYRLDHAPICKKCDAYQCHRCVWLNKKQTLEVNTPGREQCVVSHVERNASKRLLSALKKSVRFVPESEIPDVDYLDPFDKIIAERTI